jgi:hypothetical protein
MSKLNDDDVTPVKNQTENAEKSNTLGIIYFF